MKTSETRTFCDRRTNKGEEEEEGEKTRKIYNTSRFDATTIHDGQLRYYSVRIAGSTGRRASCPAQTECLGRGRSYLRRMNNRESNGADSESRFSSRSKLLAGGMAGSAP